MHAVERRIAEVAGAQDNVISTVQLLAAGLGRGAIRHRAKAGRMRRLHSGVYLVGYAPPTQRGRARAAVLSCPAGATVSHRSAAELWGLLPPTARDVDVTVTAGAPRKRPGITIHRSTDLPAWQIRHAGGLPITSPARTISDLAGTEPTNDVEHALQEARVKKLVTDAWLRAVANRTPTKKGAVILNRLLDAEDDRGYTRSKAER
ncbi:MAG TPA: type IV toxin-antitoxin system AbiEi family antitoxin domain-containing protein, partial [Solirubrobacteraceae bacterium]